MQTRSYYLKKFCTSNNLKKWR